MTVETSNRLRLTRRFATAPERVFAAWFDPPTVRQWLFAAPSSEPKPRIEIDARVGGSWVSEFLELSGLSAFVGASDGAQHALKAALEAAVVAVADEQRKALAEGMAPRRVTVCEDETFHPGICWVAIEPVSNFILLEQYAADRTAATWTAALDGACAGLAVEVIQSTADEAQALRRHAETDLGAHHSPDLFHGQHEVSKATALALARDVRHAEARLAAAQAQWQAERAAQQVFEARAPRPLGRPPAFETRIQAALTALVAAEAELARAQARQTEARELIRELGLLYHPYDPQTGQAQPVERVAARFAAVWARLHGLAEAADLPNRARERLAKAERLTVQWLATIAFFFATVTAKVEALDLPPALDAAVLEQLVPALYLERAAARSTGAATRHVIPNRWGSPNVIIEVSRNRPAAPPGFYPHPPVLFAGAITSLLKSHRPESAAS